MSLINPDARWWWYRLTMMSLKSIGLRTACFLMAGLPELGLMDKGQIAKLPGVSPLNRDSGLMRGKRMIAGGRDALYIVRPAMKALYTNLRVRRKPSCRSLTRNEFARSLTRAHEAGYSNHQRSTGCCAPRTLSTPELAG